MKKFLTIVLVLTLCVAASAQNVGDIKGMFAGVTLKKSLQFSQTNYAAGYLLNPGGAYYQAVGVSWDSKLGLVSLEFPAFVRMKGQLFLTGSFDPFDVATSSGIIVRNPSIGMKAGGAYVTKKPVFQELYLAASLVFVYKTYFDAGEEAQVDPQPLATDNLGSEVWFTIALLNIL